MKKFCTLFLIIILILAISLPAIAGTYTDAKVIGGRLNVRKNPNTDATIKGYFHTGDLITVTDYDSDAAWLQITSGPYNGYYVMRKFVDVTYSSNFSSSLVFGTSTLSTGSTGKYVYNLQHALNRFYDQIGHAKIAVDGIFGPATKNAVKDFQGSYQSTGVDGIFGYWTRWKMETYISGLSLYN